MTAMSDGNISPANSSASNGFSGSYSHYDSISKGAVETAAPAAPASLAEVASKIRISVDLVAAARRHLVFIRSIASSPFLHHPSATICSIRRYEQIWMPMIVVLSSESSSAPMILPPPDVDWVWLCHCLDSERYREYCVSRFGKLVDRPAILDEENEEYAAERCREIWSIRHPSEPFDLEINGENSSEASTSGDSSCREIILAVDKHKDLYSFFSDPFVPETVYLVAARKRYLNFLYLLKKSEVESFRIVPASDIRLMWHTHQSFPGIYMKDIGEIGDFRVVEFGNRVRTTEAANVTMREWEAEFDEPYERAGAAIDPLVSSKRLFFNWDTSFSDVNRVYKGLQPRFLVEVIVFLKGKWEENGSHKTSKRFLRVRTVRCHKELKLDNYESSSEQWRKIWHLFCEFGTRGIVIEVCQHGHPCLGNSKLLKRIYFYWNDLLHSATLTLVREIGLGVNAMASLTPPVQAAYLLKSVPDCVTDDTGAMISDVILKMNHYRPQEGRWLTRTVLDHAGRECFVIRTRVGVGFWRRGAETPSPVKWDDRIVEVREGQWSYVASSIGHTPDKVVGTATPTREDSKARKLVWSLSTGDTLTLHWEHGLSFQLQNKTSDHSILELRQGRQDRYQVKEDNPEEEQYYITLIRSCPDNPLGKATALLNWKLQAAEFLPEEDAVFVLLLNMAILRTMSQIRKDDVGGLLIRHRLREVSPGLRDWGSVVLPTDTSSDSSPHSKPWYWNNTSEVLAPAEANDWGRQIRKYSPAGGNDELYRSSIMS